eukprot:gene3498-6125_t
MAASVTLLRPTTTLLRLYYDLLRLYYDPTRCGRSTMTLVWQSGCVIRDLCDSSDTFMMAAMMLMHFQQWSATALTQPKSPVIPSQFVPTNNLLK